MNISGELVSLAPLLVYMTLKAIGVVK